MQLLNNSVRWEVYRLNDRESPVRYHVNGRVDNQICLIVENQGTSTSLTSQKNNP